MLMMRDEGSQIERYVLNEVYQLDVKTKEGYNFFAFSKGIIARSRVACDDS